MVDRCGRYVFVGTGMSLRTFITFRRDRSSHRLIIVAMLLYLIVVVSFLVTAVVADVDSTSVFTPNLANVSCYRIPSVVQTKSGVLLAFAEARHGSCGDNEVHEIALRRSKDGGERWGKVSFPVGNKTYWVGNPAAVAREDGTVVVVFAKHDARCTGDCATGNGVVYSADDGVTWSEVEDISSQLGVAKGGLPGPGTALQLTPTHPFHPRRLLIVSHMRAYVHDFVSYSNDGGTTWTTNARPFPKMDEAALTELSNGFVMLNMRHQRESTLGRGVSISRDGGDTFGEVTYDKALVGPVCQASIVSFNGATYFSNPADAHRRDKITIRRSQDNAVTWESSLLVHAGKTFGYSCLVKGPLIMRGGGQSGGILFESANESVAFAEFPLGF